MDFAFSEEQDAFRETLARFFAERAPSGEVRKAIEGPLGYDVALWKEMAEQLGLMGVHLPESCGGQGFGFLELGIVVEEMGRVLLPGPYLSSAVTSLAIASVAGADHPLLAGLADGSEIGALAWVEAGGGWDAEGIATISAPEGDALRVTGTKTFVADGQAASFFLVAAREAGSAGDEGLVACLVRADAPGVRVEPVETTDPLRRQACVAFEGAAAERLGAPDAGAAVLARARAHACILLGAEMTGAADRALAMAVDYAKARRQFARAIGSFQAIKHKAADILLELELARSIAYWALWVADEDGADLDEAAHLAKSVCGDALRLASEQNIQIHGGVGFTWEYDAHLYYKRWQSSDVLYGDATDHRAQLAGALGF